MLEQITCKCTGISVYLSPDQDRPEPPPPLMSVNAGSAQDAGPLHLGLTSVIKVNRKLGMRMNSSKARVGVGERRKGGAGRREHATEMRRLKWDQQDHGSRGLFLLASLSLHSPGQAVTAAAMRVW